MNVKNISANIAYIAPEDTILKVDCSVGNTSISFSESAPNYKEKIKIVKTDNTGNIVSIHPNAGETIDTDSGYVALFRENQSVTLAPVNGGWVVFDDKTDKTAYAEIYVAANSTAQAIPTGDTYTKITGIFTDGATHNCAIDTENSTITIAEGGTYKITGTFASKLGTTDVVWDTAIFVNDEEQTNIHMRRRFSTSGYTFSVALDGLLALYEDDVVDIRSKHNNGSSVNITVEYANINLYRIGDLAESGGR